MTFAWYGHLNFKNQPMFKIIFISRFAAFFEYCFQAPADKIGYGTFTASQLKTIQQAISLTVLGIFFVLYLKKSFKWNYLAGFLLMAAAVFFCLP